MTIIVIERDHFLNSMQVLLDPAATTEQCQAWADFFAHDVPDFPARVRALQGRLPGLYPATVLFADDQQDLRRKLPQADAVLVESLRIDAGDLAYAPRLACVQRFGGAIGNIDLAACAASNVAVEILQRRVNTAVAEQAFLLMIALAKQTQRLANRVTEVLLQAAGHPIRPYDRRYTGGSNFARIPGLRMLQGATFGQVGMGEIGRELALRAAAFGMRVLYTQRTRLHPGEEFPARATYVTLPELLAAVDYVSLNLPSNASTRDIIDAEAFRRLKPGAVLVNVSRAELIDRAALLEALHNGRLAAFGADVWYEEPVLSDDPILGFDNVLLMPHTAIAGREYTLSDLEEMCFRLWRHVATRPPVRG